MEQSRLENYLGVVIIDGKLNRRKILLMKVQWKFKSVGYFDQNEHTS